MLALLEGEILRSPRPINALVCIALANGVAKRKSVLFVENRAKTYPHILN